MRQRLGSLVLILWLVLFGYAAVYSMILSREHRPFEILDTVAHGLVVFVAFVVAFAGSKPVTGFLFGLLNLYTVAFVFTLVAFDGKIAAYDLFVGSIALALCALATVLVHQRARGGNIGIIGTRTDTSDKP